MATNFGRKLTREYCMTVASKVNSLRDLRKDESVYQKCYKMGWLKEFAEMFHYKSQGDILRETFIKRGENTLGYKYRTDEELISAARQFTRLLDFRMKCPDEYQVALKRKLIPQMTWLSRAITGHVDAFKDTVYVYEFAETHSAYVGRSIDIKRRHSEHLRHENDAVYQHAMEYGFDIPEPKILHVVSNQNDGAALECIECENYAKAGWNILNRCKCGGKGLLGTFISKDSAMRVARKCTYIDELRKHQKVYSFLQRNGLLSECTWLIYRNRKKNGTYNDYDTCLKEAVKYTSMMDFRLKSSGAYAGSKRNGWIKEFTWLKVLKGGSPKHPVEQYDFSGDKLISRFESIRDANIATGIDIRGISAACHKKHRKPGTLCRCGGFVWKFADGK